MWHNFVILNSRTSAEVSFDIQVRVHLWDYSDREVNEFLVPYSGQSSFSVKCSGFTRFYSFWVQGLRLKVRDSGGSG